MEEIEYSADGLTFTGYLADGSAAGKTAPGILVAHEASGVNDHVLSRAEALAERGYVSFVLDLYGEKDFELATARSRHAELMSTHGAIHRRAKAALDVLRSLEHVDTSRLAAIGFCQGGTTVLELARAGEPLSCVVGFHPGLQRPAGSQSAKITSTILMMVGADDPVVTLEHRIEFEEEMRSAQADWELHVFGGAAHSFTNEQVDAYHIPGLVYDADADRKSWELMCSLFERTL